MTRGSLQDQLTRRFTLSEKVGLSAEVAVLYVRARWSLRRTTIEQAVRAARRSSPAGLPPADEYRLAFRLGRVVERELNRLPGDTRCLTRSLVLVHLLARRGIDTKLVIGVKSAPFEAHAWVEYKGEPLLNPGGYGDGRLTEV